MQAFVTCRSFDMDLVELPTKAEHDHFLAMCQEQAHQFVGTSYSVGASYVGAGLNDFYWMTTGERVDYSLKWAPTEPNNINGNDKYLNVRKYPGKFLFNDVNLSYIHNYICQNLSITYSQSSHEIC